MKIEKENEQEIFNQIINTLFQAGSHEPIKFQFRNEDIKFKLEILKLICGIKAQDQSFQIKEIIDKLPRNGFVQQRCVVFLNNMTSYSLEEMILQFDSISSNFFALKKEKQFIEFLKLKKYRAIPFFTMIGFISYINLRKDVSEEIKDLMKSKYMKKLIEEYITKIRKSLFNIILYYNKSVLNTYDESNNDNLGTSQNLLFDELKNTFERYICFNELYDDGEIVNFVNCLHSAITNEIKSIYLNQGPEISIINNIIKYILNEILENFAFKDYYTRSNLNKLYDLIAEIIKNLSEESLQDNYAKFIIQYCRYFNQGNKNIVFSFFSGLNPDNLKETFTKIDFNGNNCDDYYSNINYYIKQISPKKNKKSTYISNNDSKNYAKEHLSNSDDSRLVKFNSQTDLIKESDNHIMIDKDNDNLHEDRKKEEKEIELSNNNNKEKEKLEENNQFMKEFERMKEGITKLNNKTEKMQETINFLMNDNKSITLENKLIKEEYKKFKEKTISDHIEFKSELYKLKNDMKTICYRDISKPIINKYIIKYKNKLNNETNLKNKKDRATKIIEYLKGEELTYYNRIVTKYYEANNYSHISKIFKDFGKKYIVGLSYDPNDIVDKVFNDYCKIILEENSVNKNTSIEQMFGLKQIIWDLAKDELID